MHDLRLVGVHEDGEHLLLSGPGGEQYLLTVDESLRAAVRRDRAHLGQLQIEMSGELRPREVQAQIRAGATAEEVASRCGWPVDRVRRYEGAVLAERAHITELGRHVTLRRRGSDTTAPTLSSRVEQRLSGRGVDLQQNVWDSWRGDDGPWILTLRFLAGGREREARWLFDQASRTVTAQDDEALWLSEDEKPPAPPQAAPHLSAVPTVSALAASTAGDHLYDVEADGGINPADAITIETASAVDLVDAMRQRRHGRRRLTSSEGVPRRRSSRRCGGQARGPCCGSGRDAHRRAGGPGPRSRSPTTPTSTVNRRPPTPSRSRNGCAVPEAARRRRPRHRRTAHPLTPTPLARPPRLRRPPRRRRHRRHRRCVTAVRVVDREPAPRLRPAQYRGRRPDHPVGSPVQRPRLRCTCPQRPGAAAGSPARSTSQRPQLGRDHVRRQARLRSRCPARAGVAGPGRCPGPNGSTSGRQRRGRSRRLRRSSGACGGGGTAPRRRPEPGVAVGAAPCRRRPPARPRRPSRRRRSRALWVARRPHQHSASTWSTSTRSASSISRCEPGKSRRPEVGGDPEGEDVDAHLVDQPGQLLDLLGRCRTAPRRRSGSRPAPPDGRPSRRPSSQRSRSSVTSIASAGQAEPAGQDRVPARSSLVKISPRRPRAAWLWSHLQGERGLAAVHRAAEEDQLGHGQPTLLRAAGMGSEAMPVGPRSSGTSGC